MIFTNIEDEQLQKLAREIDALTIIYRAWSNDRRPGTPEEAEMYMNGAAALQALELEQGRIIIFALKRWDGWKPYGALRARQ